MSNVQNRSVILTILVMFIYVGLLVCCSFTEKVFRSHVFIS